jgi:hypothetical protein
MSTMSGFQSLKSAQFCFATMILNYQYLFEGKETEEEEEEWKSEEVNVSTPVPKLPLKSQQSEKDLTLYLSLVQESSKPKETNNKPPPKKKIGGGGPSSITGPTLVNSSQNLDEIKMVEKNEISQKKETGSHHSTNESQKAGFFSKLFQNTHKSPREEFVSDWPNPDAEISGPSDFKHDDHVNVDRNTGDIVYRGKNEQFERNLKALSKKPLPPPKPRNQSLQESLPSVEIEKRKSASLIVQEKTKDDNGMTPKETPAEILIRLKNEFGNPESTNQLLEEECHEEEEGVQKSEIWNVQNEQKEEEEEEEKEEEEKAEQEAEKEIQEEIQITKPLNGPPPMKSSVNGGVSPMNFMNELKNRMPLEGTPKVNQNEPESPTKTTPSRPKSNNPYQQPTNPMMSELKNKFPREVKNTENETATTTTTDVPASPSSSKKPPPSFSKKSFGNENMLNELSTSFQKKEETKVEEPLSPSSKPRPLPPKNVESDPSPKLRPQPPRKNESLNHFGNLKVNEEEEDEDMKSVVIKPPPPSQSKPRLSVSAMEFTSNNSNNGVDGSDSFKPPPPSGSNPKKPPPPKNPKVKPKKKVDGENE